jgi:predicted HNH restriction endonuclease
MLNSIQLASAGSYATHLPPKPSSAALLGLAMNLTKPQDLFALTAGDAVTKRNLFDLIQYSKVPGSPQWGGEEALINNTPQQGINWIGDPPACRAVIIKTSSGSYESDGWEGEGKAAYRYSFKVRSEKISYTEKANAVLIGQPQYQYPIILFTDGGDSWIFEGSFSVSEIEDRYVVLVRGSGYSLEQVPPQGETVVKVHPDGTGALKKTDRKPSASVAADGAPRFIWLPRMLGAP